MREQVLKLHQKVGKALENLLVLQKIINLQPEPHPSMLKEARCEPTLIDEVLAELENLRLIEYIKLVDNLRRLTRSLGHNLAQGYQEIEELKRRQNNTPQYRKQYGEHLNAARKAINQACQQGETLKINFEQLLQKFPEKSAEGVPNNLVFLPTPNSDEYSLYEGGINKLRQKIDQGNPRYDELLIYETRLRENINKARLYGDDKSKQSERNEILYHLNNLAKSTLDISFNELCK